MLKIKKKDKKENKEKEKEKRKEKEEMEVNKDVLSMDIVEDEEKKEDKEMKFFLAAITTELRSLREELELKESELNFLKEDRDNILESKNFLETFSDRMLEVCMSLNQANNMWKAEFNMLRGENLALLQNLQGLEKEKNVLSYKIELLKRCLGKE